MDPTLAAKIATLFLFAAIKFGFGVLPSFLLKKLNFTGRRKRLLDKGVGAVLCFGGGVLLATVFVHILPEVRESLRTGMEEYDEEHAHAHEVDKEHGHAHESDEEEHGHAHGGDHDMDYPFAELVTCSGFFVIVVIEAVVGRLFIFVYGKASPEEGQDGHHGHGGHGHGGHGHSHALPPGVLPTKKSKPATIAVTTHRSDTSIAATSPRSSRHSIEEKGAAVGGKENLGFKEDEHHHDTGISSCDNSSTSTAINNNNDDDVGEDGGSNSSSSNSSSEVQQDHHQQLHERQVRQQGADGSAVWQRSKNDRSCENFSTVTLKSSLSADDVKHDLSGECGFTTAEAIMGSEQGGMQGEEPPGGSKVKQSKRQKMLVTIRTIIIILALSVHSIFEGMAVGLQLTASDVWKLFLAIILHDIPVHLCIGIEMVNGSIRRLHICLYFLVLAAINPLGIIIGIVVTDDAGVSASSSQALIIGVLQGLAGGTLLYITFYEVLDRNKLSAAGMTGLLGCVLMVGGFAFMAGIEAAGGHSHGVEKPPSDAKNSTISQKLGAADNQRSWDGDRQIAAQEFISTLKSALDQFNRTINQGQDLPSVATTTSTHATEVDNHSH